MAEFTGYQLEYDELTKAITHARKEMGDLKVPFRIIANDFYKSQWAIFGLQGPGKYPDFKPSFSGRKTTSSRSGGSTFESKYRERKIKKWGHDYPLLLASGALADSVTDPNDVNAELFIGKSEMEIGSKLTEDYGKFHQSDAPRDIMPLRKYLFIGPEAKRFATSNHMGRPDRWVRILQKHMEKAMTRNGGFAKE